MKNVNYLKRIIKERKPKVESDPRQHDNDYITYEDIINDEKY